MQHIHTCYLVFKSFLVATLQNTKTYDYINKTLFLAFVSKAQTI